METLLGAVLQTDLNPLEGLQSGFQCPFGAAMCAEACQQVFLSFDCNMCCSKH